MYFPAPIEARAEDIMVGVNQMFSLSAHLNLAEARELTTEFGYSRIPVYDRDPDDVVGIVHSRDILASSAADRHDVTLESLARPDSVI